MCLSSQLFLRALWPHDVSDPHHAVIALQQQKAAFGCLAAPYPEIASTHMSGSQAPFAIAAPPLVQLLTSPW